MFCTNCGTALTVGAASCGACGGAVAEIAAVAVGTHGAALGAAASAGFQGGNPAQAVALPAMRQPTQDGVPFRLAHGEVVKATYPLTRTRGIAGRLNAQLFVTDARIVYRAEASNWFNKSTISQEVQLADVSGVEFGSRRGLTPAGIVGAAALALLAVPMLASLILIPVLVIAALVIFALMRSTAMTLAIHSRQANDTPPISLTNGGGHSPVAQLFLALTSPISRALGLLGILDASVAQAGASTPEAQAMFAEIGALILDLQGRGVFGAE